MDTEVIHDRAALLRDTSQSQWNVAELSASKMFVTLTCNMNEHFGVKNVFNAVK